MVVVSVAAEWQLLYNRYYRKLEIYQMQWKNVNLARNKIACAPFGGPIAVIRDDEKIVQLYAESALRKLRIFTASGVLISETIWKNPGGRLIGMSWTDDLILVCITQDGSVYFYNIYAELVNTFSLGKECIENSVVECVFSGNGVVCINEAFEIFSLPDLKMPKTVKLPDCNLEELQNSMAVIDPQCTKSGDIELLIGVEDHVLLLEEDGVQQHEPGIGPLQKIVVSRRGEYVACFTHDGRLLVLSVDFSNVIIEYTCEVHLAMRLSRFMQSSFIVVLSLKLKMCYDFKTVVCYSFTFSKLDLSFSSQTVLICVDPAMETLLEFSVFLQSEYWWNMNWSLVRSGWFKMLIK